MVVKHLVRILPLSSGLRTLVGLMLVQFGNTPPPASNNDVGIDWSTTTLNIPTSIQTEITAGNDFWMKYEQLNIQQNGADYFAIRSFWLNDNDNAASYPAGTVVMSANKI